MTDYSDIPDETVIWRYMRLAPFLELLMNSALFATRVDAFEDASEGAVGHEKITIDTAVAATLGVPSRTYTDGRGQHDLPHRAEDIIHAARRNTAVTCWFKFPGVESFPMWRVYGGDSFAVAVVTTVGALRSIYADSALAQIGAVAYEDLPATISDIHTLFFHKRPEYRDEKEIRSVEVFSHPLDLPYTIKDLTPDKLDALLSTVVAAPLMRQTMYQTLLATLQSRFLALGLVFEEGRLRRSSLDQDLLK